MFKKQLTAFILFASLHAISRVTWAGMYQDEKPKASAKNIKKQLNSILNNSQSC